MGYLEHYRRVRIGELDPPVNLSLSLYPVSGHPVSAVRKLSGVGPVARIEHEGFALAHILFQLPFGLGVEVADGHHADDAFAVDPLDDQ